MSAFQRATLLLLVGCVWLGLSVLAAVPRVSVRAHGGYASEPTDWWVVLTVEPHADHRLLVIETVGDPGEYRRSDYQLEGERAARVRQFFVKRLSAGCYQVVASVYDHERRLDVARGPVLRVIGPDGPLCE
ncbi:MAG TPA: hypothetical protein VEA16_14885 [Vicinamibacterales bacterium]|nr:hypothetical protein [Vicinamibacterales bacterium]